MSRGKNLKNKKLMLSVHGDILDFIHAQADSKGIKIQEQLRLILGEWFIAHGGGRRVIEIEARP